LYAKAGLISARAAVCNPPARPVSTSGRGPFGEVGQWQLSTARQAAKGRQRSICHPDCERLRQRLLVGIAFGRSRPQAGV